MADREFSQFTAGGTGQAPTDTLVGLDLSLPAADQNSFWTLNNLFSVITRNITDGALRFGGFAAPSLSGAGTGALYFDSSANVFKVSSNGGAFVTLGDISGTFTATGQVAVANGTKSVTGSNGLTYAAGALTVGESGTPGGVRLVATSGNYWNIASSTPAGNRTFYFPDSITPTTGNFLFVGTFGATVVTDWSTGLTWSNTTKQLTVTAALNDVVGLGVQNTSAGTAAQCQVGFTANGGAISLLSLTGTGFTTSGLYKANQLYWRGTTGITEMLFALDDASTAFKFGVNNAVAASINATSTEGLVLGIASTLTGRVKLFNSAGATYTQISAGNAAANLNYILPATSPTAGQVLTAAAPSGGDVVLSWGAGGGGGAPVDATYLTLSLNGTLTNERVFTLADTTLSEVDGGAGGAYTLGVNQGNAFAWTAVHTWQPSTSQVNAISLLKATIGSAGQRDSDRFLIQAKSNDGTDRTIEARQYINVVSNDGVGSLFTIDGRNTFAGAGFNTLFTLNISSGDIVTPGTLTSGTASAATGALNLYSSGSANVTTLQAGAAASALTFVWPVVDPTAGQVLSASAPSGGTVTLSWATASGGTTINSTNGQLPYRVNSTTFGDSAFASNALNSTYLQATSGASGAGLTLAASGGGTNEQLTLKAKGESAVNINGSSTTNPTAGVFSVTVGNNSNVGNGIRLIRPVSTNYVGLEFATLTIVDWSIGPNANGFGFFESASGASTAIMIAPTTRNVGIGKSTSLAAQLDVLSGSTTRPAGRFQAASGTSATQRLLDLYNGATADIGGWTVGGSIVTTNLGTAPSASVTDSTLLYTADAAAADAQLFARNEAGFVSQLTGNLYTLDQDYPATTTTLANITGGGIYGNLSANVQAGKSYNFRAVLLLDANATGGWKVAMGGTCTATTFRAGVLAWGTSAGLVATLQVTALGSTTTGSGVNAYEIIIEGYISVNAAGTLTVQFAQNSASGTSYVKEGSYFQCWLSNR